jgi:hypothetical protein
LGNEGGQPRLVEHRRHLGLQAVAEAVGVVVHPSKEARRHLLWGRPSRLAGLDPPAEQVLDEHAERAARIVELLHLVVAAGNKRLVERDPPTRCALEERCDIAFDLL